MNAFKTKQSLKDMTLLLPMLCIILLLCSCITNKHTSLDNQTSTQSKIFLPRCSAADREREYYIALSYRENNKEQSILIILSYDQSYDKKILKSVYIDRNGNKVQEITHNEKIQLINLLQDAVSFTGFRYYDIALGYLMNHLTAQQKKSEDKLYSQSDPKTVPISQIEKTLEIEANFINAFRTHIFTKEHDSGYKWKKKNLRDAIVLLKTGYLKIKPGKVSGSPDLPMP